MKAPPGASTRHTSSPRNDSCLLITRPNAPSANGSRPARPGSARTPSSLMLSGAPPYRTTGMPSGRSRRAATGTFGGQASVATVLAGRGSMPASTSPPPVPMSSIAVAAPARAVTSAVYRHGGSSARERASSQLKSQPENGAACASAMSRSNDSIRSEASAGPVAGRNAFRRAAAPGRRPRSSRPVSQAWWIMSLCSGSTWPSAVADWPCGTAWRRGIGLAGRRRIPRRSPGSWWRCTAPTRPRCTCPSRRGWRTRSRSPRSRSRCTSGAT